MSTRRTRSAAQGGLWGRQQPLTNLGGSTTAKRSAVNDLDLVTSVVWSAEEPGYVVIGVGQRVFLRDTTRGRGFVVSVPRYEADAVAQLLDSGHLRLGGTHVVSDGRHEGQARSVLVTTATRALVVHWAALTPPTGRRGDHR